MTPTVHPLRCLLVEDSEDDARLVIRALRSGGYEAFVERVETRDAMQTALAAGAWDVVLSDFTMPRFNGLDALALLRASGNDLPFIVVSGAIGEDLAVETMRAGAHDYVMKANLARLAPAITRELQEARKRKEHREAQLALHISEQRYRALFAGSPLPAYVFDLASLRFLDVSDSMVAHYGYSRAEFLRMTTLDIRPRGEEVRLRASIAELTRTRSLLGIWHHRKKDGTPIQVEITAQVIDYAGQPAGLVLAVDRTEQLRMEAALRASEEHFREMAANIGEVFWMKDPASRMMLYLSPAFEGIWGRPSGDFYTKPDALLKTIDPLDHDRMAALMAEPVTATVMVKYRIQRPDGTMRWIRDRAFPVRDATGAVVRVVGVAEDVTEHQQLEQSYLRAQRMESLGHLAGGIAHDLNNILAPVLMAAPLLREPRSPASNGRIIDTVEASARRGAELVKQLLLFGRGGGGEHRVVRLKDAVHEVQSILGETLPKECELVVELPRDLWLVKADATQMHQVLLNLCVNARDAMPHGGTLTISGENRVLAEWEARPIAGAKSGPHVLLRVADTGTGIPAVLLGKIFDPFFTTKPVGKGTGLGLATVAGIARNHGGFITVQSEPGHGSTFCVGLPALVDETTLAAASAARPAPLPTACQGEEILLVDDEEAIRTMLGEMLTHHGYMVHTASSGVDGAGTFVEHSTRLRAVISDLNMPKMGGLTMLQLIRQVHPTIPLIVLSGTVSGENWPEIRTELDRLDVKTILPKPFTVESVLTAVHLAVTRVPAVA